VTRSGKNHCSQIKCLFIHRTWIRRNATPGRATAVRHKFKRRRNVQKRLRSPSSGAPSLATASSSLEDSTTAGCAGELANNDYETLVSPAGVGPFFSRGSPASTCFSWRGRRSASGDGQTRHCVPAQQSSCCATGSSARTLCSSKRIRRR
jgi:hypothetical protein